MLGGTTRSWGLNLGLLNAKSVLQPLKLPFLLLLSPFLATIVFPCVPQNTCLQNLCFGLWEVTSVHAPSRAPGPMCLHTYHLLEEWWVAFSKEYTEVQDLWDVKQEVIVEDFSKCRGWKEMILRKSERQEAGRQRPESTGLVKSQQNSQEIVFKPINKGTVYY